MMMMMMMIMIMMIMMIMIIMIMIMIIMMVTRPLNGRVEYDRPGILYVVRNASE